MASKLNEYKSTGFTHLENAIPRSCIDAYIDAYAKILIQQLEKLGVSTSDKSKFDLSQGTAEYVDSLVLELDSKCRPALNEASTMARNSLSGHRLAVEAASAIISLLTYVDHAQVSGPSLFVNIPNNPKGKYTAHAESHWYPKRYNFTNLWIPVIRPRTGKDSMVFYPESHKAHFPFCKYVGYGDVKSNSANKQYEIPEKYLKAFSSAHPENCQIGDVIAFDRALVHSSVDNPYRHPLYAITVRIFDYSYDPTLSSNWAEVPYQEPTSLWRQIKF